MANATPSPLLFQHVPAQGRPPGGLYLTGLEGANSISGLSAEAERERSLAEASEWIGRARRVAVLTGAGISQESGVPVFRGPRSKPGGPAVGSKQKALERGGPGGLWRSFRPESRTPVVPGPVGRGTQEPSTGLQKPEELATPEAFARDPKLVWVWYHWRRSVIARAEPNRAHRALAELERAKPDSSLITQNVDGLEERAGSHRVIRLHGDIWRLRCTVCGREETNREVPLEPLPPRCRCGGLMRPGVVWFGEGLPEKALGQALEAARRAEVFLVVGTSAVVYPAAALPGVAREHGARLIEVNPEATELSAGAHLSLRGQAGELLPILIGLAPK